ncbi:MAG: Ig-like domain-containing protein, partial [Thermoguttaceae bacterium]
ASYAGTVNFAASISGSFTETVNPAPATVAAQTATTNVLIATTASTAVGQWVGFLAAVRIASPGAAVPTGAVTFYDGANVLGTTTLDANGNATLFTHSLTVGAHTITASYAGAANLAASTSGNFIETITPAATTKAAAVNSKAATPVTRVPTTTVKSPLAPAAVDQVLFQRRY